MACTCGQRRFLSNSARLFAEAAPLASTSSDNAVKRPSKRQVTLSGRSSSTVDKRAAAATSAPSRHSSNDNVASTTSHSPTISVADYKQHSLGQILGRLQKPKARNSRPSLVIKPLSKRPVLTSVDLARDLVRAWEIDKMHDAVVVEPYAGAGALTTALLELKNVKKVLAVEESKRYGQFIKMLRDSLDDPERLHFVENNPYKWESYSVPEDDGFFDDVPKKPWDQVHENLFLASVLPHTRNGETLAYQIMTVSASRSWLYKYGRFRTGLLISKDVLEKYQAPIGSTVRRKLAVTIPAIVDIEQTTNLERHSFPLAKPGDSFHIASFTKSGAETIVPVLVTPKAETSVEDFEVLDYVARNMFISRATGWATVVAQLSPGAGNLVPRMIEAGAPADLNKKVTDLDGREWVAIANVYNRWPFKPETLDEDVMVDTLM